MTPKKNFTIDSGRCYNALAVKHAIDKLEGKTRKAKPNVRPIDVKSSDEHLRKALIERAPDYYDLYLSGFYKTLRTAAIRAGLI